MIPGDLDLFCERGADFNYTINVQNVDESAADLSNWSSKMQVRRRVSSSEAVIELSTTNGRLAHSGNTITLTLTDEETDALECDRDNVYSLVLSSSVIHGAPADPEVKVVLLKGKFYVV